ncbi:hypothetical protein K505DRAFT_418328 [Melanomma pulvis-pyrius CBS 109.77]|uniref:L domain-like protein n=1 Tax=Melanomma pulvis-pyrius CBS 109.77 TaxID=1314802 RepID=A0A6A6X8J4_9PLEO|nr:hypothetical protein K505DRAFT_418328 [Melanomma pulvis-pyrius CBS 109.77]
MEGNSSPRFSGAHFPSSPPFHPRLHNLEPTSSEPATSPPLFSSDDPPDEADISNYESPRRKRKYQGAWWTSDGTELPARRKRTKLSRAMCLDSGCWMGSNDSEYGDSERAEPVDTMPSMEVENLAEHIKRATKDMSAGEAMLYQHVREGIERNETAYVLTRLYITDTEIRHLGALDQVIKPPPDPGADVPAEEQYRSMVPEIYINLSNNKLFHLEPSLFTIQHLTRLVLRFGNIHELPPQFLQLRNLTELDLNFNKLTCLPAEIIPLLAPHGKLERLQVTGNPLLHMTRSYDRLLASCDDFHLSRSPNENMTDQKTLEHFRSVALPEAIAAGADQHSIVAFWDAIKAFEVRTFNSDPPSYHRSHINNIPLGSELTRPELIFIASTSISYYNQAGQRLPRSAKCPQTEDDDFDYIVRMTDKTAGPRTYGAPATWFEPSPRTYVRSLSSMCFNRSLKYDSPAEVAAALDGDMPVQVEAMLKAANENLETQFQALRKCYCCGRQYAVVAAEWVEFWASNHDRENHTDFLPVKVQVCSWGCVPDELAAKP